MLVQAWVQKEKRPEYQSASWQPEPELSQPPPRSVSSSVAMKLQEGIMIAAGGVMICLVCLPVLKQAYLTTYGNPAKGTIQQRYSRETRGRNGRNFYYYLVVKYDTRSGPQTARLRTSRDYYARSLQGTSVPIHYLARFPSQVVLDHDQLYRPWQILMVFCIGVAILWLPYYIYRGMRTIAESGTAVKGLITKINQRLRNRYLTVYYEFQEVPYQGTLVVRANQAKVNWQPGQAVTLLVAPEPPSSPYRPHAAMVYPASEFKINS